MSDRAPKIVHVIDCTQERPSSALNDRRRDAPWKCPHCNTEIRRPVDHPSNCPALAVRKPPKAQAKRNGQ